MAKKVTIALSAIAGYGSSYAHEFLDNGQGKDVELVAVADPRASDYARLAELKDAGAQVFASIEEMYQSVTPDLLVSSTPIQIHRDQVCTALGHGSSILCEKPAAATIQDARAMAKADAESQGFVAIGYQMSFCESVQRLKGDIMAGDFGKPLRMQAITASPRRYSYYNRNNWAGGQKSASGEWILDSPLCNATAHYLHNIFYILGDQPETSAGPREIQAELYRANDIENYDTAALRCSTQSGVEILYLTTHAVADPIPLQSCYEFEKAIVEYDAAGTGEFVATFGNGEVRNYGKPDQGEREKLWQCVEAVRTGARPLCDVAAATPHVLCVDGAQESMPEITPFPVPLVAKTDDEDGSGQAVVTYCTELRDVFLRCYSERKLPSELGDVAWARAGEMIDLTDYERFPASS